VILITQHPAWFSGFERGNFGLDALQEGVSLADRVGEGFVR
jgi:hypothetical protein